jgi:hypothetical protein
LTLYVANPLADTRWDDLVDRHPSSSAFHQRGWLEALSRTYNYEPIVLTVSPPDQPLADSIVFCRMRSPIVGNRLVSLPFADHCEPLVTGPEILQEFGKWLREERDQKGLKYVEIRPLNGMQGGCLQPSRSYAFHELDLEPSLEEVFARLHRDSIQRRIQRATKEQITYDVGSSSKNLYDFYRLLLKTRRRHRLLPQPLAWFENLVACMGDSLEIRVARKNATPVAAILTLRHKTTVVYKYGCSDRRFHNFGAMPFLFWRLIDESKSQGMKTLDFGRSDLDQESLMAFKDRFGTRRTTLTYYRYPKEKQSVAAAWSTKAVGQLCYFLPERAFALAGKIVYPHIG